MSDFDYIGRVCNSENYFSPASGSVFSEEKTYVEPNPSEGKRYANLDDCLADLCTPEQLARVKVLMATQTVGTELTSMRIRSGISQKMMAAALGVSQPRISAIETAPNSKISMKTIQRYVEVTRCPFKAVLEDGGILTYTLPGLTRPRTRRKKPAAACV